MSYSDILKDFNDFRNQYHSDGNSTLVGRVANHINDITSGNIVASDFISSYSCKNSFEILIKDEIRSISQVIEKNLRESQPDTEYVDHLKDYVKFLNKLIGVKVNDKV